ncbi:hypothetical protein DNI29_04550 [Hymenobacter sediminis]|nr:hypothetical protein DNI29_04550 [Hymenobacter sediminis]
MPGDGKPKKQEPWIGVDLDGTLAHYDGWKSINHIGEPVPAMQARVKQWLAQGKHVKIFTARVFDPSPEVLRPIVAWCRQHLGRVLPVTCVKDMAMTELWDDRAIQVVVNTGERVDKYLSKSDEE